MEIILRKAAIAAGLKHYFTDKPCKHGHVARRHVNDRACMKCRALKTQRYYQTNSEEVRRKRREYHYIVYRDDAVRTVAQERTRQWVKDNPDRYRRNIKVSKHRRRAQERNVDGSFTADDIKRISKLQRGKCAYCRNKLGRKYHVDHIVPIAARGTNYPSNLQLLCPSCNLGKAARDPIDHAQSLGLLV